MHMRIYKLNHLKQKQVFCFRLGHGLNAMMKPLTLGYRRLGDRGFTFFKGF